MPASWLQPGPTLRAVGISGVNQKTEGWKDRVCLLSGGQGSAFVMTLISLNIHLRSIYETPDFGIYYYICMLIKYIMCYVFLVFLMIIIHGMPNGEKE